MYETEFTSHLVHSMPKKKNTEQQLDTMYVGYQN